MVQKSFVLLTVVLIFTAGCSTQQSESSSQKPSSSENLSSVTKSPQPNATVVNVIDGDTIEVAIPTGEEFEIRFACIDTAETPHTEQERASTDPVDLNQFQWGERAKNRLTQLLSQSNNQVILKITGTDRYKRTVAEVKMTNGLLVQQVLASEGQAMVYEKYLYNCPSSNVVKQAEAQAKQQQAGVWADPNFIPPWLYRDGHKSSPQPTPSPVKPAPSSPQPTPSPVKPTPPPVSAYPPACASTTAVDECDCDDFASKAEAQKLLDDPNYPDDPFGLDGQIGPVTGGIPGEACDTFKYPKK